MGPLKLTIFLAPCCWPEYVIPFVQLGQALARRGFSVSYLGGNAGPCSFFGSVEDWSEPRCRAQFESIDQTILGAEAKFQTFNERVMPQVRHLAEEWFAQHEHEPVRDLSYKGMNLWDKIKGSYVWLRREDIRPEPDETVAQHPGLDRFIKGFVINYETTQAYLEETRPDAILIFNGFFYQERIASELAQRLGIRVIAHENSCFADRKIFDSTGTIGNYTSVKSITWPAVRSRKLNAGQLARLDAYLKEIYRGTNNTIGQAAPVEEARIRQQLAIGPMDPIALFLGQIHIDTVVVYDLHAFQGMLDLMTQTIEVFRKMPDLTLVVRFHPREFEKWGDVMYQRVRELNLPANVRLVHGREINTYSLMALADFGITATSQSGLEMLSMRKPLVVAGDAFFAGKGFTFDVPAASQFESVIRDVARTPRLSEEQWGRCQSFLYHVIFEHQVPFDRINLLFTPEAVDRIDALLRGASFLKFMEHS